MIKVAFDLGANEIHLREVMEYSVIAIVEAFNFIVETLNLTCNLANKLQISGAPT